MDLFQEMEYFLIWASTSGVRAPPGAEASFYSLVILRIFICLSFQKCIINDTFAVNYLKCYSYNVRNCFFIIVNLYFTIMYFSKGKNEI